MNATLPTRPYLKPWYRVARTDTSLIFHFGNTVTLLEGKAATALIPFLLPRLDGRHTAAELEQLLGDNGRPAVRNALAVLAERDLLIDGPPIPGADLALAETTAFAGATAPVEAPLNAVAERLRTANVAVVGSGRGAEEVVRALRLSGLASAGAAQLAELEAGAPSARCDLIVAAPAHDEMSLLTAVNRHALAARRPWLQLLGFNGAFAAVGPMYLPWETACYECFRLRRGANVDYPQELFALDGGAAAYDQAPALHVTQAGLAALVVIRWIVSGDATLPGAFQALTAGFENTLTVHHVLRVPRCTACSPARGSAPPMPWHEA